MVSEFMANDYSLTAFAGHIGVTAETITKWRARYPEFDESCKIGANKRVLCLETKLNDVKLTSVKANVGIFKLKATAPLEYGKVLDINDQENENAQAMRDVFATIVAGAVASVTKGLKGVSAAGIPAIEGSFEAVIADETSEAALEDSGKVREIGNAAKTGALTLNGTEIVDKA
jgi:hypothetical protein